jgi:ABC-type polysaccharide/polyol phosphate export permease
MSFEEKRAWIYAAIAVVVPVVYAAVVLRRLAGTDAADVAYIRPLITAIVAAMVLNIVLNIVAGMFSRREDVDRKDERDRQIHRIGEFVGFHVMSLAALGPLVLAMAEVDYFWIANALYLAFCLAALGSAVAKIVVYRRGF